MQMICCPSHRKKTFSGKSIGGANHNRWTIHQTIFMDLLLSCHSWKCPISGEDLSELDDFQIDGHHMYFVNARDDFGTAWRVANDEKVTREVIRQTVFNLPEAFAKVAIEEALACIPVTPQNSSFHAEGWSL